LLPPAIAAGPVRTDWVFEPSAELGGDAFGYQQVDEHRFAGYLLDVSGHGIAAAVHTASVINVLRQRALPNVDMGDPGQVLSRLNEMFQMDAHGGLFFTIWYGVYDVQKHELAYASGGHHAAYLVDALRHRAQPLRTRHPMIGAMPALVYRTERVAVSPGSQLYIFSDGVFEVTDTTGRQRTLPDFLPLLTQPAEAGRTESERLFAASRRMARPGPPEDDVTLLTVGFGG
jgi:serine phosphatase RsbU (regulator of sigma subunit)